jgi:hypothetical protein
MIAPTVGRVVWFRPGVYDTIATDRVQPLAAIIAHVWGDRMVNLTVMDRDGFSHARTSIQLVQEGDPQPQGTSYCEWMPYQKGQAAKTEALEAQVKQPKPGEA